MRELLDSKGLAKHRAMVHLELEVLAKKFDRFGWDRDDGTAAQDRMILDWVDALQDYPLEEVQAACKAATLASPNRMPNEGHVLNEIRKARLATMQRHRARQPEQPSQPKTRITPERAAEIMREAGIAVNRMPRSDA